MSFSSFKTLVCGIYRSSHFLKINQRQLFSSTVSRRLWKSFSWISSGWRRTWMVWHGGCSTHHCTLFRCPFRELWTWALLLLQKSRWSQDCCQVVCTVLVSSGPTVFFICLFWNIFWQYVGIYYEIILTHMTAIQKNNE